MSYIFKRIKFDKILVDFAVDEGVEFYDRARVFNINQGHDHIIVSWDRINDDGKNSVPVHAKTKICIGADGVNSDVRKLIDLDQFRDKPDKLVTLVIDEAEPKGDRAWEMTTEHSKPAIASYFFSGFLGFAWLAPARETVNVGIGAPILDARGLRDRFQDFLANLGLEHELGKSKSYTIPAMPLRRVYCNRTMLVGDAAGTVNPWTGGGINLGFHSALIAAQSAAGAVHNEESKNGHKKDLHMYQHQMNTTLKMLRLKGNLLKSLIWCYNHKLTSPGWEQFILKHTFPMV